MEIYQSTEVRLVQQEIFPAAVAEDPLNEAFTDVRIVEPTFFFHWKERKMLDHGRCKQAAAAPGRHAVSIDLNFKQPRTGGVLFEDESAQFLSFQFMDLAAAEGAHLSGLVDMGLVRDQPGIRRIPLQTHSL